MADRSFFFGFVVIKGYDYWWGYTAAQIELMCADVPVVNYGEKKKFGKVSNERYNEVLQNWNDEKQGKKNSNIKLTDILNGEYTNGEWNKTW